MSDRFIPWAEPSLWGNEEAYVVDALRSTWISGGPYVERFERDLASYLGVRHAVAVANGTAALHLAYLALGINPNDEIIVPGFAFMAAANIAVQMRARPTFSDVDPATWCLHAEDVRPLISPRTKAIVTVHTYGNMCAMSELLDLADRHGIPVIEDTAEALGSSMSSRQAGTFGAIGTFSFHATKSLTTGEGGMLVTQSDELADSVRLYRSHGLRRSRHYWHEVPGHNFRLTNLQAALGCAQFENFERMARERQRVVAAYAQHLAGVRGITMQKITSECTPLIWAVAVQLDPASFPHGRDAVMNAMYTAGVETRPGFQPPSQMNYLSSAPLPTSEKLGAWVLSLPTSPTLADQEIERVCGLLAAIRERGV
ncbi:MAG: DegT/DnrJ/EryC1/StrS family aminotransferase [Alphaproteobacteria bacterium]|nr:DegT/DnrJ/EryC1/StrS family aminotransferase [Alphaproteobacteria bacterium]